MRISDKLKEKLFHGTSDIRKYICSKFFFLFAIFYFSEFFIFKIPPFHEWFYSDAERLTTGELTEALWIAFRESAKTSIAKIFIIWCICYKKKYYICYDCYNKENSEAALFDITVELQTNEKIIGDFGHLYTEKREKEESQIKRISSFLTTNKIRVRAFSTQESVRGAVYKQHRPDLYILDDIETIKTRESRKITRKIILHIKELRGGLGNTASTLYLGNYITEVGVIAYLMKKVRSNPKGVVRNVPVEDKHGNLSWPDKYVRTDEEAESVNAAIENPNKHKVSLESKRRDLGERTYNEDMMNDPAAAGEPFFDRDRVSEDIKKCKKPLEVKAGFRFWSRYKPNHRYAIGADTASGVGRDSNASTMFDFSMLPIKQVGSYASNEISADIFAHELHRQADLFGTCLIAPEVNSQSGGTCLNELKKIHPIKYIYRQVREGEIETLETKKLGWETNSATKPEMFFKFRTDYEDGLIQICDIRILKEMKSYTKLDLSNDNDEAQEIDEELTRHFDLLTATVIAYAMKNYAKAATIKTDPYVQPAYERPGLN